MKKLFCILLVLCMLLSLTACAPAETQLREEVTSWLKAGFGRVDITPHYSIGLDGSGNSETRRSKEVADNLYMTCVALTDDTTTILVYTVDNLGINANSANLLRNQICMGTGIPVGNIFFGATHTHSAPDIRQKDEPGIEYLGTFIEAAVSAAHIALGDLSPALPQAGTGDLPGMNFVRHYKMSDGSYAGSNFGTFDGLEIVDYAGSADPELSLIKFQRGGDKQDILLMNWQAHPNRSTEIGYYKISADFVGAARSRLEEETGMLVAYFTGASGNVHIDSKIKEDSHGLSWKKYGEKLADMTMELLPGLEAVGGTGIATTYVNHHAPVDHSWEDSLDAAQEVYDLWKSKDKTSGDELGKQYGFTSVYQARSIIERAKLGKTLGCDLYAFRVGDLGFTTGTYEMFSEAGKYVKDNSPFPVTFVITGNLIYIPTEAAYEYRCYEADTGYYAAGTSEALAEKYVEMLTSLK